VQRIRENSKGPGLGDLTGRSETLTSSATPKSGPSAFFVGDFAATRGVNDTPGNLGQRVALNCFERNSLRRDSNHSHLPSISNKAGHPPSGRTFLADWLAISDKRPINQVDCGGDHAALWVTPNRARLNMRNTCVEIIERIPVLHTLVHRKCPRRGRQKKYYSQGSSHWSQPGRKSQGPEGRHSVGEYSWRRPRSGELYIATTFSLQRSQTTRGRPPWRCVFLQMLVQWLAPLAILCRPSVLRALGVLVSRSHQWRQPIRRELVPRAKRFLAPSGAWTRGALSPISTAVFRRTHLTTLS